MEVTYHTAFVLYQNEIIETKLTKSFSETCNQNVFPGDQVFFNSNYEIVQIKERKNILKREKQDNTRKEQMKHQQIVAVNIDFAIIVVSFQQPPLHSKLIDRYLILLQNSNIPFLVCFNKCELKTKKEEAIVEIYRELNIPILETSTIYDLGIETLKEKINQKQVVFVGHSGVGKSSLIQKIMGDAEIKVGNLGTKSKRGCHTTTTSKIYQWNENSFVIDTSGIRSLGLGNFDPYHIQDFFPEIYQKKSKCKYHNCLHYQESDLECYIKKCALNGNIFKERYDSYRKIVEDILKRRKK